MSLQVTGQVSGSPAVLPVSGYETTFITKPDLSDDALKALKAKIENVAQTFGGELVHSEDWGRRKFAYPIGKESRGNYTYLVYTGRGDVAGEVERNLRIHESVIRFLSVQVGREFDKNEFLNARAAQKKSEEEAIARSEAREHERYDRYERN